jgi:hypothetical protein
MTPNSGPKISHMMIQVRHSSFPHGDSASCRQDERGAFHMYDLKTATQLYVLEGHERRSMSSLDGRRIVTVSLEEGIVLV